MKYKPISNSEAIRLFLDGDSRLRMTVKESTGEPFAPVSSVQAACFRKDSDFEFCIKVEPIEFTFSTSVWVRDGEPHLVHKIDRLILDRVKEPCRIKVTVKVDFE